MQYLDAVSKMTMISVHFQGKPFNITVIQVYVPTTNAEEAEVERFYEDLQDRTNTQRPLKNDLNQIPYDYTMKGYIASRV